MQAVVVLVQKEQFLSKVLVSVALVPMEPTLMMTIVDVYPVPRARYVKTGSSWIVRRGPILMNKRAVVTRVKQAKSPKLGTLLVVLVPMGSTPIMTIRNV